jgi:hypothetical protein
LLGVREATALAQGGGDIAIAIFFDAAHQLGAVELVRVHSSSASALRRSQCSIKSPNN